MGLPLYQRIINQIKETNAGKPSNVGRYALNEGIGLAVFSINLLSMKILLNKNPNKAVVQLINKMGKRTPAWTWFLLQVKTVYSSGRKHIPNNMQQDIMLSESDIYHSFMDRRINKKSAIFTPHFH